MNCHESATNVQKSKFMKNLWFLVVISVENQRNAILRRKHLMICRGRSCMFGNNFFPENVCGIEKSCIFAADLKPRW